MQHTHNPAGLCPTCFGFPVVAVAIGTRTADGSRRTNRVRCGKCTGSGLASPATPSARVNAFIGARS
ncbi:hypothetical protein ACF1HU_35880 [Streptomyces olivaceus]|uniref:hypothetical protein n=1 Tax=Streptomyces olivaceus TaxID=47716 RepID=UPI00370270AB